MNRIKQFFKNLNYLSKFSLKERVIKNDLLNSGTTYEQIFENFLYYIPNSNITRPKIYNRDETAEFLAKTNYSLARFGDGELEIIKGNSIPYQEYNENLANRLKEILKNNQKNLMVGINRWYFYPVYDPEADKVSKDFQLYCMPKYRNQVKKYINIEKQHCDAALGCFYCDKEAEIFYEKLRKIWLDKEIITICCKNACEQIDFDIFDNSLSRTNIYVSHKHAFREYNSTLELVKKYDKRYLIILMCGPCAKVLASDLTILGYRALDLGHIAKGYDYYKKGIKRTVDTVVKFYSPD